MATEYNIVVTGLIWGVLGHASHTPQSSLLQLSHTHVGDVLFVHIDDVILMYILFS